VNLEQLDILFSEISRAKGVNDFVVVGSLSVLGLTQQGIAFSEMLASIDVDAYPEHDPKLTDELGKLWGQGSEFERKHGYYYDAVPPELPTLPDGWEARMISLNLPSGVHVKFLEPNDAAVSKYARGEAKDRQWIREGLRQSILSLATIEYRFHRTSFLDQEEHDRAKTLIAEDRGWLVSVFKA
jgi:hypothetical protein